MPQNDTGLDGLALGSVSPGTLVPGSQLTIAGTSFVDGSYGVTELRLQGTLDGQPVDVALPATFVDYEHLRLAWVGGRAEGLPADSGQFTGSATIEVASSIDGQVHRSAALSLSLQIAARLTPALTTLQTGVIYVNTPVEVTGGGFLLGGDEGQTVAVVAGCFRPDATPASCNVVGPVEVPVQVDAGDRTRGTFAFKPRIAGISPGQFSGTVKLSNRPGAVAGGGSIDSAPKSADYTLVPPEVFSVAPTAASLGQYVLVQGGGFIGPEPPDQTTAATTLELSGTFTLEGASTGSPVSLVLVPEFVAGPTVRYVLNEDDELGHSIDLRHKAGTFVGTVVPVIALGADTVRGDPRAVTLGIAHVKQVVWLRFQPAYVESLRHFGLRALDRTIRDRVLAVARRDYAGVNLEFRVDPPSDFALFSTVDIGGPDINGLGYFGYDNSPGKDVDNLRLYDQIGGLNATTQQDGQAGYGGVFVESMFSFSTHPNGLAPHISGASPLFDSVFDPFRPDVGGAPALAADVNSGIPTVTGADCPAGDRPHQIACAVWVLGSMIGTTMTHEVGHSLGLAAPHGDPQQYHDPGDQPNRLMDSGGARTFNERAELQGEGPAVFCDEEYAYLRQILPSSTPAPTVTRPFCN